MTNRIFQFGHDQALPTLAFRQAEPSLHLNACTLIEVVEPLLVGRVGRRPAKSGAGEMNAVLLAELEVDAIAVDFVCQHLSGIMPRSLLKSLNHGDELRGFVVRIER